MRAAGTTLTLAELQDEAAPLAGYRHLPISTTSGRAVVGIEGGPGGIELNVELPDRDESFDKLVEFVQLVADGGLTGFGTVKSAARSLLAELDLEA